MLALAWIPIHTFEISFFPKDGTISRVFGGSAIGHILT
jgi:hypothetical protein